MLEFPEIRDIAPPVEPSASAVLPWMWWVAAAVLALLLLGGLLMWIRSVSRKVVVPPLPARPDKWAAQALEALRQAAPQLNADDFAAQLSEIIRTFLHRQTGVLARYATSPEILGDRLRADQPPPPPGIAAFRDVMTAADALKYGPTLADRTVQTDALIDSALAAVKSASVVEIHPPSPPAPASPFPPASLKASSSSSHPPPLPSSPPALPGADAGEVPHPQTSD